MSFDRRVSRKYTSALLDAVAEGAIDKDSLINDLLGWMSESDVKEFCQANDLVEAIGLQQEETVDNNESQVDWDSLSPAEKLARNLEGMSD